MTKNTQAENFVHCWICWIIYISVFSWTVVLIVMSLSFVCMSLLTDRTMSTRCGTVTARGSCSGCGWRAWVHCHRPRPSHHAPLHFPFSLRSFTSCRSRASQVHQFHLITWYTNSGDTRSRNCTSRFVPESCTCVRQSGTSFLHAIEHSYIPAQKMSGSGAWHKKRDWPESCFRARNCDYLASNFPWKFPVQVSWAFVTSITQLMFI